MLSEEEKNKIEEEESYRANLRNKQNNPPKKNHRLLGLVLIAVAIIFIGMVINAWNNAGNTPAPAEPPKGQMLNATIGTGSSGVSVQNDDKVSWKSCEMRINGAYVYTTDLQAGVNLIPYSKFVKGDQRFNNSTTKPTSITVECQDPKATGAVTF